MPIEVHKRVYFRMLTYLAVSTTVIERDSTRRGRLQRNLALEHLKQSTMYGNLSQAHVYFADDDNIYDSHFLNEVRIQTRKLSIFNVGLIGGQTHEGPFINDRGKVRL